MTTLTYAGGLPTAGSTLNSIADPEIVSAFNSILAWANGNVDGLNMPASLTGRRQILTAYGSNFINATAFATASGDMVQSGTNQGNRGVVWAFLDPANYAVTGKSNTQLVLRVSLATNATAPAASFTVQLDAVSFGGATSGNIVATAGSVVGGSAVTFTTPAASTAIVAETAPFAFPAAGAYAPVFIPSGASAVGNLTIMAAQLFVLNS